MASITSSNTNGVSVSYTYDSLNRLGTVVDSRLGTTSYSYDPASNLTTVTDPNNVQSAMSYDTLNRITGLATQTTAYSYQRGPTGNLTSGLELNGRQVTWSYDGMKPLHARQDSPQSLQKIMQKIAAMKMVAFAERRSAIPGARMKAVCLTDSLN